MDRREISTVLERAAYHIDAHGLKSGGFGDKNGPVCVNAAIAVALGIAPSRLGWWRFFRAGTNVEMRLVAEVVVRSRLLDSLPPPAVPAWSRRRGRRQALTAREVLLEVARWSDAPGRTATQAAGALRARARAVLSEPVAEFASEDVCVARADLVLAVV